MVEITTATVASAAERIASASYFWGQTSTGPIVERRYALTDFLTKDASGNVLLGGTSLVSGEKLSIQQDQNAMSYSLIRNANSGASSYAGIVLNGFGNTWAMRIGSTAANSNALDFVVDVLGSPVTKARLDTSGNLTLITATGAVGYGTGAGGAITQATSRTTGVTLNKPCGAITLVSAAGSTSWQSFTVSNSLVAATDVIKVVQKSGTDKYMIHVTAVAAGSFVITFATTGGTTTEQPVFNFAIVRGVTS